MKQGFIMNAKNLKIIAPLLLLPYLASAQAPLSSGDEIVTRPMSADLFAKKVEVTEKQIKKTVNEAAKQTNKAVEKTSKAVVKEAKSATSPSDRFYHISAVERSYFEGTQISVNAQLGSLKREGTTKSFGTSGYGLRLAKEFDLGQFATTTTGVNFNFYNVSDENSLTTGNQFLLDAQASDWGFSQRIALKREHQGTMFKPFFEAGLGFGKNRLEGNIDEEGTIVNYDIATSYTRFTWGLGVEALLHNNLVPYVKFQRSDIQQSDRSTSEVNSGGTNIITTSNVEKVRLSSNIFTLGIGYQF
jgi:opacity protein-like surface antigen